MKVIFLGTPDFASSVLEDLLNSKHKVVAVVTQPDKEVGRGKKITYSPVKEVAIKNNIPIFQFKRIKNDEAINKLKEIDADIMVTSAYGQILSQKVIDICPFGVINTHASLLPKYRGAAPIQWAVIKGEQKTGVTIMKTDIGMDTGDIILTKEIDIKPEETAGELFDRLKILSGKALIEAIDSIENGTATYTKQKEENASHYPMLKKEDGLINFKNSAYEIVNLVKGLNPWPCAYTFVNNQYLKVHKASIYNSLNIYENAKIGEVVLSSNKTGLVVKANNSLIRLNEIQAFGSKKMSDIKYLNGKKIEVGTILGEDDAN